MMHRIEDDEMRGFRTGFLVACELLAAHLAGKNLKYLPNGNVMNIIKEMQVYIKIKDL